MAMINISGFSNIHVSKMRTQETAVKKPEYETPIALRGAKNVEVSLNFESTTFYADNIVSYNDNYFSGGEITLTVSGLNAEEYKLLFGNTSEQGGITVNANDVAPEVALTFEKKILGTQAVRRFVIYACKMAPSSISAETLADGVTEEPIEINGVVRALASGEIYAMVDTNANDYDVELDNWHEEVKFLTAPMV